MTARHDNTSKQCSKCGAFKEFSLFHLDGRGMGIGGRKAVCKACDREILAARRARKRKPPVVPTCFYPETKVLDADGRDWAWAFVWYKPAARASRYTVGSDGKVWSQGPHGQWIELRPCSGDDGRMKVGLFIGGQSVRIKVHKIVMETFWGPCPEGLELCHNNGNPSDNRLSNLRYDTHSSNMMDRVEHGTANRGERHGMAKLSKPQAIEILRRLADGERPSAIALDFGVSAAAVKAIDYGITWAYLPRPEPVSRVFYGPTDPRE